MLLFENDITRQLKHVTKKLNQIGIGVLRFDFNGCGQIEGNFEDMTVPNEIEDLINVIAYVRQLSVTKNISLLGHCKVGFMSSMLTRLWMMAKIVSPAVVCMLSFEQIFLR